MSPNWSKWVQRCSNASKRVQMIQISPKQVQGWGRGEAWGPVYIQCRSRIYPGYIQAASKLHPAYIWYDTRYIQAWAPQARRPAFAWCLAPNHPFLYLFCLSSVPKKSCFVWYQLFCGCGATSISDGIIHYLKQAACALKLMILRNPNMME